MEKLTQENARIRLVSERVPLLESKLARAEEFAVNAEQLEKRLHAAFEDRNVFEERYLRVRLYCRLFKVIKIRAWNLSRKLKRKSMLVSNL